jgi:8-oxo-dGTP pyrophosphatase MutT (NUDIX family)
LLVKPTYHDRWSLPGGYVNADDYPHQACARELREELGLEVHPNALGQVLLSRHDRLWSPVRGIQVGGKVAPSDGQWPVCADVEPSLGTVAAVDVAISGPRPARRTRRSMQSIKRRLLR